MSNSKRRQRTYDHRLKELVRSTGIIDIALQRGVPRSTVRGWLTKNMSDVITVDVLDMSLVELQREVVALRRRNARLIALLRLIITVMKVTHFTLSQIRLPQEAQKLRVLQAIEYSRKHFPLKTVLRVIGLSHGRYREWKRVECGLDDLPSCPRLSPHQLTVAEMRTIQEMVTSEKYRHVATGALARLAERMGEVFASPSTWYRLVRIHKWRTTAFGAR